MKFHIEQDEHLNGFYAVYNDLKRIGTVRVARIEQDIPELLLNVVMLARQEVSESVIHIAEKFLVNLNEIQS